MENTYRIARPNVHNWTVEKWDEGGVITRGPHTGEVAEPKWKPVTYHSHLEHAARAMMDKATGDLVAEGQAILDAIEAARDIVLEAVKGADVAPAPKAEANLAIPAEWHEEIRNSKVPVKTYLRLAGRKRFKRSSSETTAGLTPEQALLKRLEL